MRARNIKPGFFTNDELAELPSLVRLLFVGMWCMADRSGRMKDRPKKIKAEVLPFDDIDTDVSLDLLARAGFIDRYTVDGNKYIQINNFSKHQSPHIKESASEIPPPPYKHHTSTIQAPNQSDINPPDCGLLIVDSLIVDSTTTDSNQPAADKKLSVNDIQNLMSTHMGQLVISGGQINIIRDMAKTYTPERITEAFEAAGAKGDVQSLNWILTRLKESTPKAIGYDYEQIFGSDDG